MSGDFQNDIRGWADKTLGRVEDIRVEVTADIFNSVVDDTPVLDGFLKGNWIPSRGVPKFGRLKTPDKSGSTRKKRIAVQLSRGNMKKDQAVFMTNSLHYAYRIEYDNWSKYKAPDGMVNKNFSRVINKLKFKAG